MGKIWSLGYTSVFIIIRVCVLCSGDAKFGCPQTASYHPAEVFSCQEKIYTALLNQASNVHCMLCWYSRVFNTCIHIHTYTHTQTLQSTPGSKYNYSDLSMITMMYVVGTIVRSEAVRTACTLHNTMHYKYYSGSIYC